MIPSHTGRRRLLHSGSLDPSRSTVLVAAAFTALLGIVLIWGVGFSPMEAVHNAAHDVRHSSGFPCH
jgi:cobalt transporter subunit CbtB